MCCNQLTNFFNRACLSWIMAASISAIGIGISVAGLCGAFKSGPDAAYWTSLISMIIGVWVPQPSMNAKKNDDDGPSLSIAV